MKKLLILSTIIAAFIFSLETTYAQASLIQPVAKPEIHKKLTKKEKRIIRWRLHNRHHKHHKHHI